MVSGFLSLVGEAKIGKNPFGAKEFFPPLTVTWE